MRIDALLTEPPYAMTASVKTPLFLEAMRDALTFHSEQCAPYRSFLESQHFAPQDMRHIEEIPPLSVRVFKDLSLKSVPDADIRSVIRSSGTSGTASTVYFDEITIRRQRRALQNIMSDFLGNDRMSFIVFDSERAIRGQTAAVISRSAAVRGFTSLARSMHFVLDDNLALDVVRLHKALGSVVPGERVCLLGFTWMLYEVICSAKANTVIMEEVKTLFAEVNPVLVHLGGWKHLRDNGIDKAAFYADVSAFSGGSIKEIIDIYGLTEQLGTVYPDCSAGHKHAPLYSEIIVRDITTLEPLSIGTEGFAELISPLPHSYPGVALLADDIVELRGVDDCPRGRRGKYFIFKKRSESVPLRGCGDTLYQ